MRELWEGMIEGFFDIVILAADLVTAPFIAICRVASDFVHNEGRYRHSDHDSRRTR